MDTNKKIRAEILAKKDKKYTWHPFTQMAEWEDEDIVIIEKGDGVYLKDVNGKEYIDGVSSLWTNVHGHRKKELDDALKEQIGLISHSTFLGLSNVPAITLAEKLIQITPEKLSRVFFADSGSEAMEVALKVAYQYQCQKEKAQPERKKFVHLKESYHGDTLGAVSIGGIDLFHKVYNPLIFETINVPTPYCYRCPFGCTSEACTRECLTQFHTIVKRHQHEIAAIVIEPLMQGAAGMIKQPKGYLSKVREIADSVNALLICDEVATGFGRTGSLFACEQEKVCPDILALGKGITGGYLPLSATLFTETIYEAFLGAHDEFKSFFHGHTYTGNQLAARVACANLEIFEKEKTIEMMQPKIAHLEKRLKEFDVLPHVGDIRTTGFMVGIELVKDKSSKTIYAPAEKIGHAVILEARKRGILIRPLGNVIVIMPPLVISITELDTLLDGVYESIRKVTENKG